MNPLPTGPKSIRSITTVNTIADIFIFCKNNRKTQAQLNISGKIKKQKHRIFTVFLLFLVETVGVENGSYAETRSPRGLQGFTSVGEHFYTSKY